MFKYGFELEGFAKTIKSEMEKLRLRIEIPPASWPVDGFPGLVEIRSTDGKDIFDAYGEVLQKIMSIPQTSHRFDFSTHEHRFSGKELAELRRTRQFTKEFLDVKNIYGKEPRNLNGKTLASFQINISHILRDQYIQTIGEKRITFPTRYHQLDIYNIVKRLDKEFADEIKSSKRQPGMYAIKNACRLEYRSLPNFVAKFTIDEIPIFLARIKKAVEN